MSTLAFLEGPDLIVVVAVVLLLFGGSQLPKLARSIGQARREFERAVRDDPDQPEDGSSTASDAAPAATAAGDETDDHVVLSRAELDALLEAKEREVRQRLSSDQAP